MSVSEASVALSVSAGQGFTDRGLARLSRPPRAISLDLDDTLWPMMPVLKHAEAMLADWLRQHAPATAAWLDPETRARLRRAVIDDHPHKLHDVGFIRHELIRRALTAAGEDPALADPAYQVFFDARQQVALYADVRPVLARWSQRVPLVALTNGNADIRRVGLQEFFRGSVSAHEIGCAKPDARAFHAVCDIAGCEPGDVLHIGDDPALDVAGAQAAGLQAAWLLRAELAGRHAADAATVTPFSDLHELDAEFSRLASNSSEPFRQE